MPWDKGDAKRFTKKATTDKKKRQWSHVANSTLERGASEGSAVRAANAAVKKKKKKKRESVKHRGKRYHFR